MCAAEYDLECKRDTARIAMSNCLPDLILQIVVYGTRVRGKQIQEPLDY